MHVIRRKGRRKCLGDSSFELVSEEVADDRELQMAEFHNRWHWETDWPFCWEPTNGRGTTGSNLLGSGTIAE